MSVSPLKTKHPVAVKLNSSSRSLVITGSTFSGSATRISMKL